MLKFGVEIQNNYINTCSNIHKYTHILENKDISDFQSFIGISISHQF